MGDTYTYYLLDGGDVVAECEDGLFSAIYTRGFNLIYRLTMDGVEYYLLDAHGDVIALTDGFGAVTKRYAYDAFDNEENPDDSDTNPFRYCGEYFDNETGTYYLRARYYDPAIGRFTQQDAHWSPANMIYGDNPRKIYERQDALGLSTYTYAPEISAIMQSGNMYVYCANSPVMYHDPSGHESMALTWTGTMWWLAGVDTVLPVGDVIYLVGIGACSIVDAVNVIGIDNIVTFFYNAEAGVSNAADWIQKAFGGGSSSPGGPNWNHRDYYLRNVKNQKLWNAIDQLYRKNATVGDGGTADKLRYEFDSGQPLRHLRKAQTMITRLERILTEEVLTESERKLAYYLLNDLYNAVKYVS